MGAGIWGVLAVGLFSSESLLANAGYQEAGSYGLLLGGGFEQFAMQVVGIVAIVAWTAVTAGILFFTIRAVMGLRVNQAEEMRGLDLEEHGVDTYPDFGASGSGIFNS